MVGTNEKVRLLWVICFVFVQGHHQEIWCLAISPSGDYVVSASHDKSLRLWERTREPLILEEERELVRPLSLVSCLVGVTYKLSLLKFSIQCSHSPHRRPFQDQCHTSQVGTDATGILL